MATRSIVGFPQYEVSDGGRVISIPRLDSLGRWCNHGEMYQATNKYGYKTVALQNPGKDGTSRVPVHRLVLEAFVGPRPKGMVCCHSNGDPSDNRLENLRWGTVRDNALDAIRHGTHPGLLRKGTANHFSKLTEQQVRQVTYTYNTGLFTRTAVAKQFGICTTTVSNIVDRKSWGHLWEAMKRMRHM